MCVKRPRAASKAVTWEQPPRAATRTSRTAAFLAVVLVAVVLGAVVSRQRTTPPLGELQVDRRPSVTPTTETAAWRALRIGVWRELPIAPLAPRVAHHMVRVGRRVFVWGGFDVAGRPLSDGGLFDPADGTWQPVAAVDTRGSPGYATRFDGDVLVVSTAATQRYDPSDNRWYAEAALPRQRGYTLTDQRAEVGDGVAVVRRPTTDRDGRPAVFMLRPGDAAWRRLPDPPVRFTDGDVLLGHPTRLTIVTRAQAGRPAAGFSINPNRADARWRRTELPPHLENRPLARLFGAHIGVRSVLVGIGAPGQPGYAAAHDGQRWRDAAPPPLSVSPLTEALWIGGGMILWNPVTATGARLDLSAARWARLPPAPVADGAPRPAAWNGSSVVTWGGFTATGAVYRIR
ncbi:hypothetical protein BH23ACT10_BH23ACT10_28750 [soil metagenome]